MLEKTLESPLDCKEIKLVYPKGNQSWIFTGRTYAGAKAPILWPPHGKNWLIRKDPDAGKDWRQEEMGATEDEMVGWHYPLNGHWANSGRQCRSGKPGVLQCMGVPKIQTELRDWTTIFKELKETTTILLHVKHQDWAEFLPPSVFSFYNRG